MLDCHACIRTCIRTLFSNTLTLSALSARSTKAPPRNSLQLSSWPQRRYATDIAVAQSEYSHHGQPIKLQPSTQAIERDRSVPPKRASLEQELRYLKDPLKLANNTVGLLRQDDHTKALELVRLASRDVACTVSWNHIIDYDMAKGRVTAAVKTYNEMKKRAQPPDAQTYTILLRGLAWNADYGQSTSRALSIYQSMFAENSPVRPSIIHTNAVLKVCARAKDLDTLFNIAAKLPTKGRGAPNNLTFTTILNAVRISAWERDRSLKFEDEEQYATRRQRAVLQGRRMWSDIVGRWRKGDLTIDEQLVGTMGRLLLLGYTPQDYDDVLSLVEQTMAIPRQVPRLDDPARKVHSPIPNTLLQRKVRKELCTDQEMQGSDAESSYPDESVESGQDHNPRLTHGSEFDSLPHNGLTVISHARPGCSTLSLVVDACVRMHAVRPAKDYWSLLTSAAPPMTVVPDAENFHMYLRLLRLTRASRSAVELTEEMASKSELGVQAKTFRIAMSACARDNRNLNAYEAATRLLKLMIRSLEEPDLKTCEMYLRVMGNGIERGRGWRTLEQGLEELKPCVANLKSLLAYGRIHSEDLDSANTGGETDVGDVYQAENKITKHERVDLGEREVSRISRVAPPGRSDISDFVRTMIGAYDKMLLVSGEAMSAKTRHTCRTERSRLAAWVTRSVHNAAEGAREGRRLRRER